MEEAIEPPDLNKLMSVHMDYGFRKFTSLKQRFKLWKKYLCKPMDAETIGETIIVKDWLNRIHAHWVTNYPMVV
eukprot:jgi/Tetstr1/448791/TSEL_036025.t1